MTYMVYTCYDAEGSVLYVGATSRGQKRLREHERRAAWYPFVELVTYEDCRDAEHASEREAALISEHTPPYNGAFRPYAHAPLVLNPNSAPQPMTLVEMAEAIGVKSTTALRRLCEQGVLQAEKKGKTWLVPIKEVERYKRERRRGRPRKPRGDG